MTLLGPIDGFGTKRIFGIYIGINQNPSKSPKSITLIYYIHYYTLLLSPHSPSSVAFSSNSPLIGISIVERLRDRGAKSKILM